MDRFVPLESAVVMARRRWCRRTPCVQMGLGAALLLFIAAGCGGSPARVSSDLPLALKKLETAQTGVVKTNFVFAAAGESLGDSSAGSLRTLVSVRGVSFRGPADPRT